MANQLEQVLKKTQAVYKRAAEELAKKLADFQARFAAKDKEKQALLAAGEITKEQYKSWLAGQVFQGKQWEAKAAEAAKTMVHANEEAAAIVNDGCMTAYAAAMNYGTYELEKATALKTGFTLYNRETVSRLLGKDPQLLPKWKIDQPKDYIWNYEKVKNAIIQGIIQGKPIPQIGKDLTSKLQTLNENKMRMFARTGMTGAHNAGRMDALHRAEDKGIKVKKKWLATNDDRTRDAHADLDGQIREVDEPFESELGDIMYPGDPSADPANVYNCRCTMVYIYPELEEAPEGTEPAPEYEQMTFDQWVEAKENQESVQGETKPETVAAEDAREPEPEIIAEAEELEQTEPEPELPEEEKKDPEDYTVDEIMEKVNAMEQAGEWDDEKKNLLPMADEETRTGAHELYMSIPENEREALEEKTTVKIADLYTEQAEVFTPRLEDLAESFDGEKISGAATEDHPTGITVAKYNDQLIVLDGNNRTNLAIMKGQDEIDVMLVDLDSMKQPEPAAAEAEHLTVHQAVEKYNGELDGIKKERENLETEYSELSFKSLTSYGTDEYEEVEKRMDEAQAEITKVYEREEQKRSELETYLSDSGEKEIRAEFGEIEGKHSMKDDVGAVNTINENKVTRNNCGYCSLAYDARRRGIDCSAPELFGTNEAHEEKWWQGFKFSTATSYSPTDAINEISEIAESWGKGARGIVNVDYSASFGHAFVFEVDQRGKCRFLDGQTGITNAVINFENALPGSIKYGRTDDKELTKYALLYLEKGAKNK